MPPRESPLKFNDWVVVMTDDVLVEHRGREGRVYDILKGEAQVLVQGHGLVWFKLEHLRRAEDLCPSEARNKDVREQLEPAEHGCSAGPEVDATGSRVRLNAEAIGVTGGERPAPIPCTAEAKVDVRGLNIVDLRCPECGEMMTSHVVVTRHAKGECDERFTGPELCSSQASKWRVLVNEDGDPYAVDNGTSRRGVEAPAVSITSNCQLSGHEDRHYGEEYACRVTSRGFLEHRNMVLCEAARDEYRRNGWRVAREQVPSLPEGEES